MLLHVQHAVANGIFVSRMNRDFRWPQLHNISNDLGIRAVGIHAFTGCDTVVSAFCGKGKKSAWQTWEVSQMPQMYSPASAKDHIQTWKL